MPETPHLSPRDALEIEQIRATTQNLQAETAKFVEEGVKLRSEASKLSGEARWHPILLLVSIFASVIISAVTAIKIFLG